MREIPGSTTVGPSYNRDAGNSLENGSNLNDS
jgi:hypothetical protein